jgi:predicted nucleic acid-binding protein
MIIWIAATALETGSRLVTYDNHLIYPRVDNLSPDLWLK